MRTASLLIMLDRSTENAAVREAFARELYAETDRVWNEHGVRLHAAGVPLLAAEVTRNTSRDIMLFLPLSVVMILGVMFAIYRNWALTVAPFLVIGATFVWTMGLLASSVHEINMVTMLLPPMIFTIATSDVIHIIGNWQDSLFFGRTREEVIARTIRLSAYPCFLTTITTVVGFLSLLINDMAPVRHLGLFAAAGLVLAYLLGFTVLPILLYYLDRDTLVDYLEHDRAVPERWQDNLGRIFVSATKHRRAIFRTSAAVVVVCIIGTGLLRVETDGVQYFGEGRIKEAEQFVSGTLAGASVVYVVLDLPGSVLEPRTLRRIDQFKSRLSAVGDVDVGRVVCCADLFRELRHALAGTGRDLPASQSEAAQLLEAARASGYASDTLDWMIDREGQRTILQVFARDSDFNVGERMVGHIYRIANDLFAGEDVSTRITGRRYLLIRQHAPIMDGLSNSALIAVFSILLITAACFRSWKVAFFALIPNFVPVVFTLGMMGLLDLPINFMTAPFLCVSWGLAVDDTMHFLGRMKLELDRGLRYPAAIRNTLLSVGRSLVLTSMVFFAGFGFFVFSSFHAIRTFGGQVSFTVVGALFADLFLLPGLLLGLRPFRRRPRQAAVPETKEQQTSHTVQAVPRSTV